MGPKQNDKNDIMKVCMQETESVMSALHSVAQAQLGPASRSDDKDEDKYLAANAYGNETSRKKKGVKHARKSNMPKHGKEEACRQINMQKTCR